MLLSNSMSTVRTMSISNRSPLKTILKWAVLLLKLSRTKISRKFLILRLFPGMSPFLYCLNNFQATLGACGRVCRLLTWVNQKKNIDNFLSTKWWFFLFLFFSMYIFISSKNWSFQMINNHSGLGMCRGMLMSDEPSQACSSKLPSARLI